MRNVNKTINGIQLDYVSGSLIPFMKLTTKNKTLEDENIADLIKLLNYTESKLKGYFTFSTLFNAYQEVKDGKLLKENENLGHRSIYADSGGLQVYTKGKQITDEIKEQVYKTQALYSDFAMTFDEMPMRVNHNNRSDSVVNKGGAVYVEELVDKMAEKSAMHIQKQIDMFESLGSGTKILPILHGYDEDSYIKYGLGILNRLNHINDHIQGIAIASLGAHADNKVGIMKIFDFVPKILNNAAISEQYKQHVHLLGVASPQRLVPILMMAKKGFLGKTTRLSFDSTAVTKAYTFGRVYANLEEYKNKRDYSPTLTLRDYRHKDSKNVRQFYNYVHREFKDYPGYVFDSVEDLMNHSQNNGEPITPSKQFEKYGIDYQRKYLAQVRYCSMYHAWSYLQTLEAFIEDELTLKDIVYYNDSLLHIYEMFDSVETWEEHCEVIDHFYTTAAKGRTNLRYDIVATEEEFEEKFMKDEVHPFDHLGLHEGDGDIDVLANKPWFASSQAKKNTPVEESSPSDLLF